MENSRKTTGSQTTAFGLTFTLHKTNQICKQIEAEHNLQCKILLKNKKTDPAVTLVAY